LWVDLFGFFGFLLRYSEHLLPNNLPRDERTCLDVRRSCKQLSSLGFELCDFPAQGINLSLLRRYSGLRTRKGSAQAPVVVKHLLHLLLVSSDELVLLPRKLEQSVYVNIFIQSHYSVFFTHLITLVIIIARDYILQKVLQRYDMKVL